MRRTDLSNYSMIELKAIIDNPQRYRINSFARCRIIKYMKAQRIEIAEMADRLLGSYLYKLAGVQLLREGRGEKTKLSNGMTYYEVDEFDRLEMMLKIVRRLTTEKR